jgi:hypothetical protein
MSDQPKCKQRWASHKNSRMADIRKLWKAYQSGKEDVPDLGHIWDYGLSFDYVAPGTFSGQKEGYWRWQISWGGPSEEFRFYASHAEASDPYRMEFVFMDWFDGFARKLRGRDEEILTEIWQTWVEIGSTQAEFNKAINE